jgi:uncharacterized membrane protein YeaQ/YmgE (transglycosylase-associated protein family)
MGIMIFVVVFIVFAIVAALAAKSLVPGPDPAGPVGTILIGMAGGLVGAVLGAIAGGVSVTAWDGRSLLLAIVGTMIALFGYRTMSMRSATHHV